MLDFVVLGGGIAGVQCAEELARLCPTDIVTLISATKRIKVRFQHDTTHVSQRSTLLYGMPCQLSWSDSLHVIDREWETSDVSQKMSKNL
jgi:NADH dehydrogenase FAD-containing subunit